LQATAFLRKFSAPMTVGHESFNVNPALLGAPLARPWRRLAAIGIDFAVIGMVSSVHGMWMIGLAALLAFRLRKHIGVMPRGRKIATMIVIGFLLWLGVPSVLRDAEVVGSKPKAAQVVVQEQDDDSSEIAKVAATAGASAVNAACIAELEKLHKEAKAQQAPKGLREMMHALIEILGISVGWAAAYFSLLPSRWQGQTLGKRLLGIRVVELTGKSPTTLHCFTRYGGYAAGMATGLLGFAQVLWDDNRQAMHDKIAHTVVVDARGYEQLTAAA